MTGPRATDPHHLRKVQDSTLTRYREALRPFVYFLVANRFTPRSPAEFDDLLVEYKHEFTPKRAAFEALVASLEFAWPPCKGHLSWSRATLAGWSIADPIHHTVPLLRAPCRLLACHIAAQGRPRAAGGLVVQRELGLRPGEVTSLFPDDITLPEHFAAGRGDVRAVVALGTRKGTKAKRIQSVVCRNPVIIGILRWLCNTCKPGSTLMGISYDGYRKLFRSSQAQAALEAGYTPHSPRAGFATESIAEGQDFVSVREAGRWLSDSSLRIYLDLVGAASLAQQHKLQGREHELIYAASHFLEYLPGASAFQRSEDYGSFSDPFVRHPRDAEGHRRQLVQRVGLQRRATAGGLPNEEEGQDEYASSSDASARDGPRVAFSGIRGPSDEEGHGFNAQRSRGRGSQGSGRGTGRGRSKAQGR